MKQGQAWDAFLSKIQAVGAFFVWLWQEYLDLIAIVTVAAICCLAGLALTTFVLNRG